MSAEGVSLKDEVQNLTGRKKKFFLLRLIGVETEAARQICGVTKGTYNTWLHNKEFAALYKRRAELSIVYRTEALRIMRRDTQLHAILLEEKIIEKIKDEIASGEYDLIKTQLAREVYSKLINDLDYQPPVKALTWEDKRQQYFNLPKEQLPEGEVIEGKFREVPTEEVIPSDSSQS